MGRYSDGRLFRFSILMRLRVCQVLLLIKIAFSNFIRSNKCTLFKIFGGAESAESGRGDPERGAARRRSLHRMQSAMFGMLREFGGDRLVGAVSRRNFKRNRVREPQELLQMSEMRLADVLFKVSRDRREIRPHSARMHHPEGVQIGRFPADGRSGQRAHPLPGDRAVALSFTED